MPKVRQHENRTAMGRILRDEKDGSVNGDLTTAQIIIEDGAYFKGSIAIEKSAALQTEITQDAISKAERIMGKIDARWPGDKVPGKL
jgi:cytoskeletal protein CcmA (bactofilin family)